MFWEWWNVVNCLVRIWNEVPGFAFAGTVINTTDTAGVDANVSAPFRWSILSVFLHSFLHDIIFIIAEVAERQSHQSVELTPVLGFVGSSPTLSTYSVQAGS